MNLNSSDLTYETNHALEFANRYAQLGSAVTDQLADVLDGELEEVNPNAIKLIVEQLTGFYPDLDKLLKEALEEVKVMRP